jgi:DNA-binding MarR family transcriptional regulator
MPSRNSVQDARTHDETRALHQAILEIVSVMNRPELDQTLLAEAGIGLERALFPLLVLVQRFGPIGVVDLAGRIGRDHSTISRQIARLEALGLIQRHASPSDGRQRSATVTPAGQAMVSKLDAARGRLGAFVLSDWAEKDIRDLVRLMQRFAGDLTRWSQDAPGRATSQNHGESNLNEK